MNTHTLDEARAAKQHAMEVFGALAEVAGVGITRIDDGYGLKINLQTEPDSRYPLPSVAKGRVGEGAAERSYVLLWHFHEFLITSSTQPRVCRASELDSPSPNITLDT